MSEAEWKLLADKLERQRLTNKHTPQTADMLEALREVALGMWADLYLTRTNPQQ